MFMSEVSINYRPGECQITIRPGKRWLPIFLFAFWVLFFCAFVLHGIMNLFYGRPVSLEGYHLLPILFFSVAINFYFFWSSTKEMILLDENSLRVGKMFGLFRISGFREINLRDVRSVSVKERRCRAKGREYVNRKLFFVLEDGDFELSTNLSSLDGKVLLDLIHPRLIINNVDK